MKKTLLLFLLFFASCKKSEVSPKICYLVGIEKTTTYSAGHDSLWITQGKPIVVRTDTTICNTSVKDLEALLKTMGGTFHPRIGVCIVISTYYYRIRK